MRKSNKKIMALALAAAMVASGTGVNTASAATLKADNNADVKAVLETKPYQATICYQTTSYGFHNNWDCGAYGAVKTALQDNSLKKVFKDQASVDAGKDAAGVTGFDWAKNIFYNSPAKGVTKQDTIYRDFDGDGKADPVTVGESGTNKGGTIMTTATFGNADVTYDGTYTVSMTGFNPDIFKYDYGFRMMYVDTTIPISKTGVAFTNISYKIDGKEVYKADKGVIRNADDSPNSYMLMLTNEYGYGDTAHASDNDYGYGMPKQAVKSADALPDPVFEAGKAAKSAQVAHDAMPKSSIEVTFTLSGMGAAPAGYVASTNGAIKAPTVTATKAAVSSLKKGKKFTSGNLTYKVTKASSKSGSATVAVAGVKKSATKKTALSVPKTVSKSNFKYKVTAVNSKAFTKATKLKKVTLGANVKTINANAFKNCKKLASIKTKAKLTKVAKKAFVGCKKTIKVSGKNKKANIKKLKKSGYKKFK